MLLLASAGRGGSTLKTQNNHNSNSSYRSNISRHRKNSKDSNWHHTWMQDSGKKQRNSITGTLGQDSTLCVCVRKEGTCPSVETKSVAPRYNRIYIVHIESVLNWASICLNDKPASLLHTLDTPFLICRGQLIPFLTNSLFHLLNIVNPLSFLWNPELYNPPEIFNWV